tara:strand:- start:11477 stop:12136 length:660 start_codon:yes stop_codon:yes gene_type:complete
MAKVDLGQFIKNFQEQSEAKGVASAIEREGSKESDFQGWFNYLGVPISYGAKKLVDYLTAGLTTAIPDQAVVKGIQFLLSSLGAEATKNITEGALRREGYGGDPSKIRGAGGKYGKSVAGKYADELQGVIGRNDILPGDVGSWADTLLTQFSMHGGTNMFKSKPVVDTSIGLSNNKTITQGLSNNMYSSGIGGAQGSIEEQMNKRLEEVMKAKYPSLYK